MKELSDHLCDMSDEIDLLKEQMPEFHTGVKQQVESILRHPPPRSLYKKNSPTAAGSHSPYRPPLPPPRTSHIPPMVPPHRTMYNPVSNQGADPFTTMPSFVPEYESNSSVIPLNGSSTPPPVPPRNIVHFTPRDNDSPVPLIKFD